MVRTSSLETCSKTAVLEPRSLDDSLLEYSDMKVIDQFTSQAHQNP